MKKLNAILIASLLFAVTSAQADYLWTWYGTKGLFQGSFEVTDAEMQPGSHFTSPLFTNSISITSLDRITYHGTNGNGFVSASLVGVQLSLNFVLFDDATVSRLSATVVPSQVSLIDEFSPLSMGQGTETDLWIPSYIPEPSPTTLSTLGMIMFLGRKCRG
jgi:hypothetical protein